MKQLQLRGVDLVLLSHLLEGPSYGYELIKRCRNSQDADAEPVTQSQVYNSLTKLRRRGLISREVSPQSDGPDRHIYRLNTTKMTALAGCLEEGIATAEDQAGTALARYLSLHESLQQLQQMAVRLTHAYGSQFRKLSG